MARNAQPVRPGAVLPGLVYKGLADIEHNSLDHHNSYFDRLSRGTDLARASVGRTDRTGMPPAPLVVTGPNDGYQSRS
ncbi:hypothetical protein NN3_51220 [Nocardia neocaledoniensis NBRC 108232]|nr:hypothetical protein NN3_51220 [Nocardia neocaledoniensis NBRC 108232]